MKTLHYILFLSLVLCAGSLQAQSSASGPPNERDGANERRPVFRATKDQVAAAQSMLKSKGLYAGDASGELDETTRAAIKSYQKSNGLRASGTLNRATLEKMGIELTDKQKAIPVSASSFVSKDGKVSKGRSSAGRSRGPVFRATKDQIVEAQRRLRSGGLYSGAETGKLDDSTRDSLKKYQQANGLKATGTLNQMTLEKMGIALTGRQKEGSRGAN